MTQKQIIYQEMFRWTLAHLRNASTWSWWRRLRDRSVYYESELIHNLPASMFDAEFGDHDIWFLNHQARSYCQSCSERLSWLYPQQVKRIRELFALIPTELRSKLEWPGPQASPHIPDSYHSTCKPITANTKTEQDVPSDGHKPSGHASSADPIAPADAH